MAQNPKTEKLVGPASYLKMPYARVLVPEQDGAFRAEILEFPGCIALGDTAEAALAMLEDVAWGWLEAALDKGRAIPEPMENIEFSGKLVLRLPKSLHKKASRAAERDGISLNQFIVSSLAQQVGARSVAAPPKFAPQIVVMPQIVIGARDDLTEGALQTPTSSILTPDFIGFQSWQSLRSADAGD